MDSRSIKSNTSSGGRFRIGCFRRLRPPFLVIILCYHTLTLLIWTALLGTTVQVGILQGKQRAELETNVHPSTYGLRNSVYLALSLRFLGIIIGFYSVRTRHSPAVVMGFTAMISISSVIMILGGISTLSNIQLGRYEGINWVRTLLDSEMAKMDIYNEFDPVIRRLQSDRECCGVDNYTDWRKYPYGRTSLRVPPSCCLPSRLMNSAEDEFCGQNLLPDHPEAEKLIYTQGCFPLIVGGVRQLLKANGSITVCFGLLDAALAIFGCVLIFNQFV